MNVKDIRDAAATRIRTETANLASLTFSILALISWLISVAFFGILGVDQDLRNILFFPLWLFELVGVFTLATGIIYTLFSYRLIGAIAHVLSWVFVLSGGCSVYFDLVVETGAWQRDDLDTGNTKYIFHFVATFFALIFHGLSTMVWHYFKEDTTGDWSRQPSHRHFKDPEEPFSSSVALTSMNTGTNAYSPRAVIPPTLASREDRISSSFSSTHEDYESVTNDPVNPPVSIPEESEDVPTDYYEDINKRTRIQVSALRNSEPREMPRDVGNEDYVVNQLVYDEAQQAGGEYDIAEEQYVVNELVYEEPLPLDTHDDRVEELYDDIVT